MEIPRPPHDPHIKIWEDRDPKSPELANMRARAAPKSTPMTNVARRQGMAKLSCLYNIIFSFDKQSDTPQNVYM